MYLETMIEVYLNVLRGQVRTKRDLYYGNCALYKKQSTLDSLVANLARTFSVPRDALNVLELQKVYTTERSSLMT